MNSTLPVKFLSFVAFMYVVNGLCLTSIISFSSNRIRLGRPIAMEGVDIFSVKINKKIIQNS